MTPLTPERIRQIQVEVLMRVMMGGVENTLTSPGMWDAYIEEFPDLNDWIGLVTLPMKNGGLLQGGGPAWVVTKDGEEFVKNYSAAKE